jgi:hypothetical protein
MAYVEKAMVTGTQSIMDWFDRNATSPYYSVWSKQPKMLLFSWNNDDSEAGRNKLESDLYAIEQNGVNDLMLIKLHPKKDKAGYITDKTPIYSAVVCRPSELEKVDYSMQRMAGMGYNSKLEETMNAILTKLNQQDLEEEEEEVEDKGVIGNLLEQPHVQNLLISGLTTLLGSFAGVKPQETVATGLAGIDDNSTNEAITILNNLMNKGVTIEHLRKLDQMGTLQLNSLLNML